MTLVQRFKRDLSKHRAKAAMLGILFVSMVAFSIKAIFEMRPPTAAASTIPQGAANSGLDQPKIAIVTPETEAEIQLSSRLWHQLREVKAEGVDASLAFKFEKGLYPEPPEDPTRRPTPVIPENTPPKAGNTPTIDTETVRQARIRDQAKSLVVKSTSLGNGNARAVAIVNQQLLSVGQEILGFEITAIRAREVEFKKDGVVALVKMSDELRGQ